MTVQCGMDFKDRLKQLRNWRGLTQDQLADKAGLVQSTVGNYETGTRLKKLNTELPALARALCVPVAELFTDTPPEQIEIAPGSQSMRLDAVMLLTANRETVHFQSLAGDMSEARWAELFATVYPMVVAGGGELRREDARALEKRVSEIAAGGLHGKHGVGGGTFRQRRGIPPEGAGSG